MRRLAATSASKVADFEIRGSHPTRRRNPARKTNVSSCRLREGASFRRLRTGGDERGGSSVDGFQLAGRVGGGQGLGHNTVAAKGQILARHADPRTTEHYDRARGNLDRHGVHFLTAYVAGV